jgi:hypothetical protein
MSNHSLDATQEPIPDQTFEMLLIVFDVKKSTFSDDISKSNQKIPDQIDIKNFWYAFVWRNWLHFDMKILEFLKSIWYQFLQTNAYQNILIAALNGRILTNIYKQVTMVQWQESATGTQILDTVLRWGANYLMWEGHIGVFYFWLEKLISNWLQNFHNKLTSKISLRLGNCPLIIW